MAVQTRQFVEPGMMSFVIGGNGQRLRRAKSSIEGSSPWVNRRVQGSTRLIRSLSAGLSRRTFSTRWSESRLRPPGNGPRPPAARILAPLQWLDRLAALAPPPRIHRHRHIGVQPRWPLSRALRSDPDRQQLAGSGQIPRRLIRPSSTRCGPVVRPISRRSMARLPTFNAIG